MYLLCTSYIVMMFNKCKFSLDTKTAWLTIEKYENKTMPSLLTSNSWLKYILTTNVPTIATTLHQNTHASMTQN